MDDQDTIRISYTIKGMSAKEGDDLARTGYDYLTAVEGAQVVDYTVDSNEVMSNGFSVE